MKKLTADYGENPQVSSSIVNRGGTVRSDSWDIASSAFQEESKQQVNVNSNVSSQIYSNYSSKRMSANRDSNHFNQCIHEENVIEEAKVSNHIRYSPEQIDSGLNQQQGEVDKYQAMMQVISNETIKINKNKQMEKQMNQIDYLRQESDKMVQECQK